MSTTTTPALLSSAIFPNSTSVAPPTPTPSSCSSNNTNNEVSQPPITGCAIGDTFPNTSLASILQSCCSSPIVFYNGFDKSIANDSAVCPVDNTTSGLNDRLDVLNNCLHEKDSCVLTICGPYNKTASASTGNVVRLWSGWGMMAMVGFWVLGLSVLV